MGSWKRFRTAGGEAHALSADIGDKHAILPLAGAANGLVGPIDVLVHNASALGPTPLSLLLDTDCEDLERVLEVNVIGPFRLSKAIAGSMALRKSGVIVHVSSDAAVNPYPHWGAYSASKAASDHLARIWAVELAERGVGVFSVDPGDMDTEMHAAAIPDADPQHLGPAVGCCGNHRRHDRAGAGARKRSAARSGELEGSVKFPPAVWPRAHSERERLLVIDPA